MKTTNKKRWAVLCTVVALAVSMTGCGDALEKKAEEAIQEAKEKIIETVKEEINNKVQDVLSENGIEGAEDFDINDFEGLDIGELENSTGLDFSALENMDKLDFGELDLSQLQELLEQLMDIDFEAIGNNIESGVTQ